MDGSDDVADPQAPVVGQADAAKVAADAKSSKSATPEQSDLKVTNEAKYVLTNQKASTDKEKAPKGDASVAGKRLVNQPEPTGPAVDASSSKSATPEKTDLKVSGEARDVTTDNDAGIDKVNAPKADAAAAGKRSERTNRGQTTRFADFENAKERNPSGSKKRRADNDEEDEELGLKAGARVELLVKGKVVGTALVMLVNPTDTIRGKSLGADKVGVVIESIHEEARESNVPKGLTSFVGKSKKLKAGDLPVCQLIDWPESGVEKLATRKKARRG